jgi:hypothetical protein
MQPGPYDRLPADPAAALFVYGTLLFPGILVALIGRMPGSTPGTVAGWRAAALPGRAHPGLVPAPRLPDDDVASCADTQRKITTVNAAGRLLTGLTPREWRVIDAFENGGYHLTAVTLVDGRRGWTYTWAGDITPLPEDWSVERFAADHLADYIAHCTAWRHRYAAVDQLG